MPASCCVVGCAERKSRESCLSFYRMPKNIMQRNRWLTAIRRENNSVNPDVARVCSRHFLNGKASNDPVNPDFAPSQHMGYESRPLGDGAKARAIRMQKRAVDVGIDTVHVEFVDTGDHQQIVEPQVETGIAVQTDPIIRSYVCHAETQTDLTELHLQQVEGRLQSQSDIMLKLQNEVVLLQQQLTAAKYELDRAKDEVELVSAESLYHRERIETMKLQTESLLTRSLNHEVIKEDDTMTKFYTGLPNYAAFKDILTYLEPHVTTKRKPKVSPADGLLLTLAKLRLNLLTDDLAYRFGVTAPTVSKKFHRWLDLMYEHLGGMVMWPQTDFVQLPEIFQNETFKNTKVIIDCFEIFIDRPAALKARAQTYSNYKKHNTAKALIGVSPSGSVIFMSQAWGGRASDRLVTLESGLLDKLDVGDVVLADRGFVMQEDFKMVQATLLVPSFTRGKNQLAPEEVEMSRILSSLRIHVERIINRCRDFRVLKGPIPINFVKRRHDADLSTLDKMLIVCGALTNISPSIVPP